MGEEKRLRAGALVGAGQALSEAASSSHGPSFLRWAGSKRKSLSQLASACDPGGHHYIEPFAGSASLFFNLRPKSATLADLNGALINALSFVRDRPKDVHERLFRLRRSSDDYYENRKRFNDIAQNSIEAAVLFIYLNRNCFNGLWRTNSQGKFNVPYGGREMGANPPLTLFERCSLALQNVDLKHQDFRTTINEAEEGAFLYADPPYFTANERTFIEYGEKSFGQQDLNDLLVALRNASSRGLKIALTYNAAMPLADVLGGWHIQRIEVTRNVGGFAGSRKRQVEYLYTNSRKMAT